MVKHHLAFLALGLLTACNTSSQSPTKDPIATTLSQISNRGPNYTLFESGRVRPLPYPQ